MALEYLTQNSLTSYPFKLGRAVDGISDNLVRDDWFHDIVFTSFSSDVRSVYISRIEKTQAGALVTTFSNAETLEEIGTVEIIAENLCEHLGNRYKSFAGAQTDLFAVKFIFGPALVQKTYFTQTYLPEETELVSAAVIQAAPEVTSLTFNTYVTTRVGQSISTSVQSVASFPDAGFSPVVLPKHNASFTLASANSGLLHVDSGAGAGLYDGCPSTGEIKNVYSVNNITPNTTGALFFNPSDCYTANVLTDNDAYILGSYSDTGYLFPYHAFVTHRLDVPIFDAVNPGHSIFLQNFCKPKCPTENLTAFAHYLNRVADGATELDHIAARKKETKGQGKADLTVFTASAFCVTGDTTFARCSEPTAAEYIVCDNKFVKYYHEGRTLQLHYNDPTLRNNFTIVEVISESVVRLDGIPAIPSNGLYSSFRVLDTGTISNMNCAVSTYNLTAAEFNSPYFKVKYTTSEAFNTIGEYVTYISVVVALFNPSKASANIRVYFNNSAELTQQGNYKIRTDEGVQIVQTPSVIIGCRKYAFIETVYYIPCETYGGVLSIDVVNVTTSLQIGETYTLPTIDGTVCLGTTIGAGSTVRVLESSINSLNYELQLSAYMESVSAYGLPSWLELQHTQGANKAYLVYTGTGAANTSKRYYVTYRSYGGAIPGVVSQLTIDYVASPVIISPLSSVYTTENPLSIDRLAVYTDSNPLLSINASNMSVLSNDFPSDTADFYYSLSGTLPSNLAFNSSSGKITGSLSIIVPDYSIYDITLSAHNAAGSTSSTQTIYLEAAGKHPPVLELENSPAGNIYIFSTLEKYTEQAPLLKMTAAGDGLFGYTIVGNLPEGLVFDPITGKLTGQLATGLSGYLTYTAYTANIYGKSNTIAFALSYSSYQAPNILSPVDATTYQVYFKDEILASAPLFTISAEQAYGGTDNYAEGLTDSTRNSYSVEGAPAGFSLTQYTGKFYGKLDISQYSHFSSEIAKIESYPIIITATNPVGLDLKVISLSLYSHGIPSINNIPADKIFYIARTRTYTESDSFFIINALNFPLNFTVAGLPTGLSVTSTGHVIGSISSTATAEIYAASATASNEEGTSSAVNFSVYVPVGLISPTMGATYSVMMGESISPISLEASPVQTGDVATITTSDLPAGFYISNNQIVGSSSNIGIYPITITATTQNYGAASINIYLKVTAVSHSVSGTVTLDGNPLEGVLVSAGASFTDTTNANGEFLIAGLTSGTYLLTASKSKYVLFSNNSSVTITNSNITDIMFTAEGPFRTVSGKLAKADTVAIYAAVVSNGSKSTTSLINGTYILPVLSGYADVITPELSGYSFSPASFTLTAGTSDVVDVNFLGTPILVPSAPTVTALEIHSEQIKVSFNPPSSLNGATLTNYAYSLDGGSTFTAFSPADPLASSITITGLTTGQTYSVSVRALSDHGPGVASTPLSATPATTPSAPTITSIDAGNRLLAINFTTPDGPEMGIINYGYTLNDGASWGTLNPAQTTSPLLISKLSDGITSLTNGTSYLVMIRAINSTGPGEPS